jgi:hypothetical protein
MATTYDPLLLTDMDWVRFLVGDRDVANATVVDEEILAVLDEEPNKYFAAAVIADLIINKSGGIVDKQVGDLRIKWSDSPENAYRRYANWLRERGAYELGKTNYIFKVL